MVSKKVTILSKTGLHLRPAAQFCQEASKYDSVVTFTSGDYTADNFAASALFGTIAIEGGTFTGLLYEGDAESGESGSLSISGGLFDDDVLAGEPGYLMYRGWKLPCFITEAEHGYFHEEIEWRVVFNAISETSTWVRETTTTYIAIDPEEVSDLGRDYSLEEGDTVSGRGYAIDPDETENELIDSFNVELADVENDVFVTSNGTSDVPGYGYSVIASYSQSIKLASDRNGFRVTFFGPCTDPEIYLDGKPVRVYTSLLSGEKLEITSNGREKTIYKISAQGVKTNAFVYRDKEHSPFFSIGKNTELTYGDISFDFTTIEQRSEPAWN